MKEFYDTKLLRSSIIDLVEGKNFWGLNRNLKGLDLDKIETDDLLYVLREISIVSDSESSYAQTFRDQAISKLKKKGEYEPWMEVIERYSEKRRLNTDSFREYMGLIENIPSTPQSSPTPSLN